MACLCVQVVQAFDPNKFNFQKALQTEVLFQFERASTDALQYSSSSMVELPAAAAPIAARLHASCLHIGHGTQAMMSAFLHMHVLPGCCRGLHAGLVLHLAAASRSFWP